MRSSIAALLSCAALGIGSQSAQAGQHLFHISEVFSNADGSVQFIELIGEANGQSRFVNFSLCAGDPALPAGQPGRQCFRFTMNLSDAQTANRALLFASQGYVDIAEAQGLPAPDFLLAGPDISPDRPFFDPMGDIIDFLPEDQRTDVVNFPAFPTDGVTSFNGPFTTRANMNMQNPTVLGPAVNSPTNFAGETGSLQVDAAPADTLDPDGDGIASPLDLCPGVADPDQSDADGDRVGDACDSCVLRFNPRVTASPGQTTTGGQIDDDADGFGNECDADFVEDGIVDARDLEMFQTSIGRDALSSQCGPEGNLRCAPFDVFPGARQIDAQDLSAIEPLIGSAPGPTCPSCPRECRGPGCSAR